MTEHGGIPTIWVCLNDYCKSRGGERVYEELRAHTRNGSDYKLTCCGCMGACEAAPRLNIWRSVNDRKRFGKDVPQELRDSAHPIHNYDPNDIDGFIEREIV